MHSPTFNWVSYETDFPENYNLKRGSPAKLMIKNNGTIFNDYNWTDPDYSEALEYAGFEIIETISPIAPPEEEHWLSEKKYSPFLIYVAKKINQGKLNEHSSGTNQSYR